MLGLFIPTMLKFRCNIMAHVDWVSLKKKTVGPFLLALFGAGMLARAEAAEAPTDRSVEISFPAAVHRQPLTGRLLLMFSHTNDPEVRFQVGGIYSPPAFGIDVSELHAGELAMFDESVSGYPLDRLKDLPPGDYFVQALLNVYTEFHRADGHVIWAHMDQWEGQNRNLSAGNLYSEIGRAHV